MIPKVIHYCWFGKKEKPGIVKKCINSWEKNLPEYKIIEWNEENFQIDNYPFAKEAYDIGNYAFVSDYVRVHALYNYGGIYLDTDTEILGSLDEFLSQSSFWGFEEKNYVATSIIGAERHNELIKDFLNYYDHLSLYDEYGNMKKFTNVLVVTELLKNRGIVLDGTLQTVDGVATIYPQDYFSPYDYINCYMKKTANSVAVHHFHKSWLPLSTRIKGTMKKIISRIIGGQNVDKFRNQLERVRK